MSTRTRPIAALFLALCGGCVPDFDDDLSLVVAPRVLAIQSEPAEAKAGEAVALSALVVDPDPLAPQAEARFSLCAERKPLTELGPVSPACLREATPGSSALMPLGVGNGVLATLPSDACRLFGPSRPEPKEGEPAGRPVDPDATGGYYEPVTARVESARDLAVGAIRVQCPLSGVTQAQSVEFATSYRKNKNPEIAKLELMRDNDTSELMPVVAREEPSAVLAPGERVTLRAAWDECAGDGAPAAACTGAESYAWFDPVAREIATQRESIRVSWFASAGKLENERSGRDELELETTSENTWTAPEVPGEVRLWLVIRDARGGLSWRAYRVEVRP
jgi:hypothetical protein